MKKKKNKKIVLSSTFGVDS